MQPWRPLLPIPDDEDLPYDIAVPLALEEAQAARAWGIPWDEWHEKPPAARAEMMAAQRIEQRLHHWLQKWRTET
jgi:hypothetical protein